MLKQTYIVWHLQSTLVHELHWQKLTQDQALKHWYIYSNTASCPPTHWQDHVRGNTSQAQS